MPQALNIVLSKVWLQQRLIGVKCVEGEEGDRIFPIIITITTIIIIIHLLC